MAYWLDDGFDTWPEIIRVGSAAAGLYVRCGAWISRNTQDGIVPAELAAMYGTPEWVTKLVAAGLWENEATGYRDVYYFGRDGSPLNPTADKVRRRKEQAAERQRRWRERTDKRVSRPSHNASRNGVTNGSPALPPSKDGKGRRPAPGDDAAPTDFDDPQWHAELAEATRRMKERAQHNQGIDEERARRGAALAAEAIRTATKKAS